MTVETATYISDLNASNPGATDLKAEGDDHLRLLKSTVKASFPGISGAMTATHTALNNLTGAAQGSSGNLGVGMVPANAIDVTKTQNADSRIQILNSSTGASATAGVNGVNSANKNAVWLMTSTGYTATPVAGASCGMLYADGAGGLALVAAAGNIRFATNGVTENMRLDTSGNLGVGVTPSGSYKLQVSAIASATNFVIGTESTSNAGAFGFTNANGPGIQTYGTATANAGAIVYQFAGVERFRMTNDGRLYGTALHNNGGSVTGSANHYIASGTYTPTLSNTLNVAASTANLCQWMRVGNVVTVSGVVGIDPTSASTGTQMTITLPIASTLTSVGLAGNANRAQGSSLVGSVGADVGTGNALLFFTNDTDVANRNWSFHFTYLIS